MDKLGKMELNPWVLILGAIALYVFVPSVQNAVDGLIGGRAAVVAGAPGVIECIYDGATMTIGPLEKKYAPTTAISGMGTRVIINGKDRGIKTDSATMDVNYKDEVAIYYAHNDTVAHTAKGGYYVAKQEFTVPCTSAFATGDDDMDPSGAHELIAYSSPSISVFADDDGLLVAKTHPENMTANDDANLKIKISHKSKAGFSPFGNYAICALYNSSAYDEIDISPITGVASVTETGVPVVATNIGHHLGTHSGCVLECWETQGTHNLDVVTHELNLAVSTGSLTPSHRSTRMQAAINLSLWDQDWYRHTDTGLMEFGYQDNTNTDIGDTFAPNATVYIKG